MNIAVDAMGGDQAPRAIVEGVRRAVTAGSGAMQILLIGDEQRLQRLLDASQQTLPVRIVHAPETVEMGEIGPLALRRKKKSSLSMAMRLLADGEVDAVVSAANSSAIVVMSKHFVGLVPELKRPVLALFLPRPGGRLLLIDAGAHDHSNSVILAQSAVLADVYLRIVGKLAHPRLGLLNIGCEPLKGPPEIRGAFAFLERTPVHFVGNVEPHQLFEAPIDAIICDGFTGNIVLKLLEGVFELYLCSRRGGGPGPPSEQDLRTGDWDRLAERYRYQKVGGAPLLGLRKPVIVAHGRAEAEAVCNAVHQACEVVRQRMYQRLERYERQRGYLAEIKAHYSAWRLGRWKGRRGLGSRIT